jgi:hypothetical protein
MTHKEFYIWLEGYLYGKLENKHIDISTIVEKMSHVKEEKYESIKISRDSIKIRKFVLVHKARL